MLKKLTLYSFSQISDVVAVARLLNATLVIPEIQSTTSSKGIRYCGHMNPSSVSVLEQM